MHWSNAPQETRVHCLFLGRVSIKLYFLHRQYRRNEHLVTRFYSGQKKKRIFLFFLFYFTHQMYGTVLQHDNARSHAARNTTQFNDNNIQNSPLAFHVPRLRPKQAHLERVGQTLRQSECPCKKCARVVSGTRAGVGDQHSASNLQPDPVHA